MSDNKVEYSSEEFKILEKLQDSLLRLDMDRRVDDRIRVVLNHCDKVIEEFFEKKLPEIIHEKVMRYADEHFQPAIDEFNEIILLNEEKRRKRMDKHEAFQERHNEVLETFAREIKNKLCEGK